MSPWVTEWRKRRAEADGAVLIHPDTAQQIELSSAASRLSEVSFDARYLRDVSTLIESELNSPALAREALIVRADELMSSGYQPAGHLHRQLEHLSPWKEWCAIASRPSLLAEYWARFGAPASLVDELLSRVSEISATADSLLLQRDQFRIECRLPLHPDRLAGTPAPLRSFFELHAEVADASQLLCLGWNPPRPHLDLAELGLADAFHFLAGRGRHWFVDNDRIAFVDEYCERWPDMTPFGELMLETIVRSDQW